MKWMILLILVSLTGCQSMNRHGLQEALTDSGVELPSDSIFIEGVRKPGIYRVEKEGISIDAAIRLGGGPGMCEVCFKLGGEDRLWGLIGDPRLLRDGVEYRIPRHQREQWIVLAGDRLKITHIPL